MARPSKRARVHSANVSLTDEEGATLLAQARELLVEAMEHNGASVAEVLDAGSGGLRSWLGFLNSSATSRDDEMTTAATLDQKFVTRADLPPTYYRDATNEYMNSGQNRMAIPKNITVMSAAAEIASIGGTVFMLRAFEGTLKDAESALSQLPLDADVQSKTAFKFEIQNIQKRVETSKKDVEKAAARFELLRPDVMRVAAEKLHLDCLAYEAVVASIDPAVRDQITKKVAEVTNAGPLERGEEVQIVVPGPRYERAQVVQESGGRPGHWELLVWYEEDYLGSEYSAGFGRKRTVPRTEIYANSSYGQVVRLPDGSTEGLPDVGQISYLLLMMQSAEASKEGFEQLCTHVCTVAGGSEVVVPIFSPLKDLGRVTKKAAGKYGSRYNKVLDVLRMMFVCTDANGVLAVLVSLAETKGFKLVRVKNRMHPAFDYRNSSTAGYHGDLLCNVEYEATGFICECQITLRGLLRVRDAGGHGLYNLLRMTFSQEPALKNHRGRLDGDVLERVALSMITKLDCGLTVLSQPFATTKVPESMTRITCHLTELKLSGCIGLSNVRLDAVLTDAVFEQLGPTLKTLEARDVGFTGIIPQKLWKCCIKLDVLCLSSNNLEGRALPESAEDFGCMKSLRIVTVGANKLLTGNIPAWIGQCSSLVELHMAVNQIDGTIPEEVANCPKLEILNVGMNRLTGSIPKSLGRCSTLMKLFINKNKITGTIPSELGNCSHLKMLFLCDNEGLVGPIPDELGQCRALDTCQLHGTQLTYCPDTLLQCKNIIGKITLPLENGKCNNPLGLNAKRGPKDVGEFKTWQVISPAAKPKEEGGGGGGGKLTAEGSAAGRGGGGGSSQPSGC
eukprot:gene8033-25379_t